MVDLLATLLVGETRLVICSHDALASPLTDLAAQIGLAALAHLALSAKGLQMTCTVSNFMQLKCFGSNALKDAVACLQLVKQSL